MTAILLSVLCTTLIFGLFRSFGKWQVHRFSAIVVNYYTASVLGLILIALSKDLGWDNLSHIWLWHTLLLGGAFVAMFNLIGRAALTAGMGKTAIATKVSFVIPSLLSIPLYGNHLSGEQWAGLLLAVLAIWWASQTPQRSSKNANTLWLLLAIFLGSGGIDSFLKYNEFHHVSADDALPFVTLIFSFAAAVGSIVAMRNNKRNTSTAIQGQQPLFQKQNILAGIALGIPNLGSIYFLMKALQSVSLSSATVFSVNNIGIVLSSVIMGVLLFKERPSKLNLVGLALAIISIWLISQ